MNILTINNSFFKFVFGFIFFTYGSIWSQTVIANQDPKFEQLLNEKRKLNSATTISNRYKIQIFIGNLDESKKALIAFKKENKTVDATLTFTTPNYKVMVGNYKTRIDAERNYNFLKKKYSKAILIKPTS